MISSSTLALGGEIQAPGKSEPPPPSGGEIQFPGKSDPRPPSPASTTEATADVITAPTSTDEIQIAWQDLTTKMLLDILLTIY